MGFGFVPSFSVVLEPEPKQTDVAAQVLWTVLCAGSREEHTHCGDEQPSATLCTNAPQI